MLRSKPTAFLKLRKVSLFRGASFFFLCVYVYLSRPITTKNSQAFSICRKLSVYDNNQNKTVENSRGEAEGWLFVWSFSLWVVHRMSCLSHCATSGTWTQVTLMAAGLKESWWPGFNNRVGAVCTSQSKNSEDGFFYHHFAGLNSVTQGNVWHLKPEYLYPSLALITSPCGLSEQCKAKLRVCYLRIKSIIPGTAKQSIIRKAIQ